MVEIVDSDKDYSSFRKPDDQECVEQIILKLFWGADELVVRLARLWLPVLVEV